MTCKQISEFISILDRFATVAERFADKEYPKPETIQDAEIYVAGKPGEPQTREEYEALPEEGRFEKKFRESHPQA